MFISRCLHVLILFFCILASFLTHPNCDVYDIDDIDAFVAVPGRAHMSFSCFFFLLGVIHDVL